MNQSSTTPPNVAPADEDLVEQAHPGHGVPSQDPASTAQFPLEPEEAEREANSVLMGGGMVAGAATGAAVGVAVAGPVGVVVGGTVGAVVGALGASAVSGRELATASRALKSPMFRLRPVTVVFGLQGKVRLSCTRRASGGAPWCSVGTVACVHRSIAWKNPTHPSLSAYSSRSDIPSSPSNPSLCWRRP